MDSKLKSINTSTDSSPHSRGSTGGRIHAPSKLPKLYLDMSKDFYEASSSDPILRNHLHSRTMLTSLMDRTPRTPSSIGRHKCCQLTTWTFLLSSWSLQRKSLMIFSKKQITLLGHLNIDREYTSSTERTYFNRVILPLKNKYFSLHEARRFMNLWITGSHRE